MMSIIKIATAYIGINFLSLPIYRIISHLSDVFSTGMPVLLYRFCEKRCPFDEYGTSTGEHRSSKEVSPGDLELRTADPVLVTDLLRRTGDFEMPALTGMFLGVFETTFDLATAKTKGILGELLGEQQTSSVETNFVFVMVKRITIHVLNEAMMGAMAR
ncbi:hypothetical protein CPLU01_05369 [Colletotrichum plurivorum]|uniref:Uncharacterized protein n=1 Tax=Colletotrichum plurivorum TaxID=2175906 RepID=A0A8H6KMG0_9PEZI|nr:hypothetical protein CPLU01_05369 [Colletotrichum plurivorum]